MDLRSEGSQEALVAMKTAYDLFTKALWCMHIKSSEGFPIAGLAALALRL